MTNYRYHTYNHHSFQNQFAADHLNQVDFTGSSLKSCDFRGAYLAGADFSETAIGRDEKKFQEEMMQMGLHIILGLPLGVFTWFLSRFTLIGCGGAQFNAYNWLTDPFIWIAAFATAATMSKRLLFGIYMGLIALMSLAIAISNGVFAGIVGIVMLIVGLGMAIWGMYLGYKKGAIAVGMVWMAVGVSSAISAGYSWIKYQEIHYAILFAALAIFPAILATRAFNLHFKRIEKLAMTSFDGANLTNARFVNAVLQNCDFRKANLEGVDCYGAKFENCKFPKGWTRENIENITEERAIDRKQLEISNINTLTNAANT